MTRSSTEPIQSQITVPLIASIHDNTPRELIRSMQPVKCSISLLFPHCMSTAKANNSKRRMQSGFRPAD